MTLSTTVSWSSGRRVRRSIDLGLDALLGQFLGRLQREADHARVGGDGDVLALAADLGLADRHQPVLDLRHVELLAVEHLVLEEDHRVRVADRGLQQALGVGGVVGRDHLQARHVGVPAGIVLAVLGRDARGRAVGAAEHDRAVHLAAGHVERLGGRIDDLVDGLHGEVEGHELDDRLQARHGRADAEAGEAVLGDRRVDHPLVAELLQQVAADLVGALVLRRPPRPSGTRLGSRRISSAMASRRASRTVILHQLGAGRDLRIGLRRRGRDGGGPSPSGCGLAASGGCFSGSPARLRLRGPRARVASGCGELRRRSRLRGRRPRRPRPRRSAGRSGC